MKKLLFILLFCLTTSAFGQFQQKPMLGRQINWANPLSKGLVGCWLFNEGSGGQVFDLSGNGNTGTLLGGDIIWTPGKFGLTLDFPETEGDYVSILDSPTLSFGDGSSDRPFSIVAWICMDDATDFGIVCKAVSTTSNTAEWFFGTWNDDVLKFYIYDDTASNQIQQSSNSTLTSYEGQWIQIAATYDGSGSQNGMKVYLNGKIFASTANSSGAYTAMHNTSTLVTIGAFFKDSGDYKEFANGKIDIPEIYSCVLSASEIALLYREPFCMFEEDLPVAQMYSYSAPPAPGGQMIMIITSAVPFLIFPAFIFIKMRKFRLGDISFGQ